MNTIVHSSLISRTTNFIENVIPRPVSILSPGAVQFNKMVKLFILATDVRKSCTRPGGILSTPAEIKI